MAVSAYVVGPPAVFAPYIIDALREAGITVLADTEQIDYELLRTMRPDLIFLDGDGMTLDAAIVLREIRQHARYALICVYTSQTSAPWVRRAYTSGANAVFAKYCSEDHLQPALSTVLRFGTFLDPCISKAASA